MRHDNVHVIKYLWTSGFSSTTLSASSFKRFHFVDSNIDLIRCFTFNMVIRSTTGSGTLVFMWRVSCLVWLTSWTNHFHSQMTGAAFPSPAAEMAEMNRIQYELEYTEGISQRMRIPEMLKVAPQAPERSSAGSHELLHSVIMQVPERIVIAGLYICPCDTCLTQWCVKINP